MDTVFIAVIVCLSLFLLVIIVKYITLKKQLRSFSRQVENRKDAEYNCPVKVDRFDKDVTELAIVLNGHTEIQRKLAVDYENSRRKLNNIISGISHDFRTPLTASLGYLQMIEKSGELSEKYAEYLTVVLQKNKYLKELSDEFFELSKLENSSEEIVTEKINLSNLISDMILEQYGWIEVREITPSFKIDDGIVIESSLLYITRIAENLFSNAKKYAFHTLGVRLEKQNEGAVLRVYNDIEEENAIDLERVFEPFYKTSARNHKGSGLGLYVVKFLSEKLGFSLNAYFDEKNCFTIEISI
ncbi:MAG: HAMP domain-containing histidine kinase [Ruminococcus sp.]|nr:HAMP domain-containing histidine kinase [Ruminococcus sp.]